MSILKEIINELGECMDDDSSYYLRDCIIYKDDKKGFSVHNEPYMHSFFEQCSPWFPTFTEALEWVVEERKNGPIFKRKI